MTPNEVKELIKQDDSYVVGALLKLYEHQTADEQDHQSTVHKNGLGFNALDAGILSDISKYVLKYDTLSAKQIHLVRLKLYKYTRQLAILDFKPKQFKRTRIRQKSTAKKATLKGKRIFLAFPFNKELQGEIKQINGFYFDPDKKEWSLPLTVQAVKKLKKWDFTIDEAIINWMDTMTKSVTANIVVPGLDEVLRDFQKICVSFIESRGGRVLVADDMGLGKTLETIAWMIYKGEKILPAIIISPATLKLNWAKEFNKWTDWGEHIEILYGTTPYEVTQPIAIINYDIIYAWMDYLIKEFKPKLIVGDEIHKIKEFGQKMKKDDKGIWRKVMNVQRSYAFERIAKKSKYCIGLTGTPFLNKPREIFNPLKVIKPGLFPNFKRFGYRYCNPKFNGWATVYEGASNTEELHDLLTQEVMIRRRKQDVLSELPDKTFALLPLEISNREEYRKATEDFLSYLQDVSPDKVKKARNAEALAKINALRQLAAVGKLKQSIEWIGDFIDSNPLVVFAWHTKVINQILEAFPDRAVKVDGKVSMTQRQANIDLFSAGKKDLFIGQIEAAGQGVDGLQEVCMDMAFIEYPWNPGLYNQACDRLHRMGQDNAVTIWNHVASETIEEKFIELLETKSQMFDQVIDGKDLKEDPSMFTDLVKQLKNPK